MKPLTRRSVMVGSAAAVTALPTLALPVAATEQEDAVAALWDAWCAQLVATREAHGIVPLCQDPDDTVPETAKLRALDKLIFETAAVGATTVCLKLAFWRYGRYLTGHPRDNRLVISIHKEFAPAAAIDFDAIAQSHGLEAHDWDAEELAWRERQS